MSQVLVNTTTNHLKLQKQVQLINLIKVKCIIMQQTIIKVCVTLAKKFKHFCTRETMLVLFVNNHNPIQLLNQIFSDADS